MDTAFITQTTKAGLETTIVHSQTTKAGLEATIAHLQTTKAATQTTKPIKKTALSTGAVQ